MPHKRKNSRNRRLQTARRRNAVLAAALALSAIAMIALAVRFIHPGLSAPAETDVSHQNAVTLSMPDAQPAPDAPEAQDALAPVEAQATSDAPKAGDPSGTAVAPEPTDVPELAGGSEPNDAPDPTAAPEPVAATDTPEPTEAPIVPLEVALRVNGEEETALEESTRTLRIEWEGNVPVAAWRLMIYNSRDALVSDQIYAAQTLGVSLDCAALEKDRYRVELSASAVDPASGSAEAQARFELLAEHEIMISQLASSRRFLAYLDADGRVVLENRYAEGEDSAPLPGGPVWKEWTDIVQIAVGGNHLVALTSDGTVRCTGANDSGQLGCDGLTGVRWIAAGDRCTACILDSGALALYGAFFDARGPLSEAKDVERISLSETHALVEFRSGKAAAFPMTDEWVEAGAGVTGWSELVDVSAGYGYSLGLRADGTVCYAGPADGWTAGCAKWTGIAAISAGNGYALGLRRSGDVISQGNPALTFVKVDDWTDIAAVSAGFDRCVGLRADGALALTEDPPQPDPEPAEE